MNTRTKKEAYQHVLSELNLEKLGAFEKIPGGIHCVYETSDGKHCGVGCLFSTSFLDKIKKNERTFLRLSLLIGYGLTNKIELENMTGLSLEELERLQTEHDNWVLTRPESSQSLKNFRNFLNRKIRW